MTNKLGSDLEHFWLMDGIVVRVPYGFSWMMRMDRYELYQEMRKMNYV